MNPTLGADQQQQGAARPYSADFYLYSFKIVPCSAHYSHNWSLCPFVHEGEKARRRDPRLYAYEPLPCPDDRKGTNCPRKDGCNYTHNVYEYWLHPKRFRTQMCHQGAACQRPLCFFAHSLQELRFTDAQLAAADPTALAAAAAAAAATGQGGPGAAYGALQQGGPYAQLGQVQPQQLPALAMAAGPYAAGLQPLGAGGYGCVPDASLMQAQQAAAAAMAAAAMGAAGTYQQAAALQAQQQLSAAQQAAVTRGYAAAQAEAQQHELLAAQAAQQQAAAAAAAQWVAGYAAFAAPPPLPQPYAYALPPGSQQLALAGMLAALPHFAHAQHQPPSARSPGAPRRTQPSPPPPPYQAAYRQPPPQPSRDSTTPHMLGAAAPSPRSGGPVCFGAYASPAGACLSRARGGGLQHQGSADLSCAAAGIGPGAAYAGGPAPAYSSSSASSLTAAAAAAAQPRQQHPAPFAGDGSGGGSMGQESSHHSSSGTASASLGEAVAAQQAAVDALQGAMQQARISGADG